MTSSYEKAQFSYVDGSRCAGCGVDLIVYKGRVHCVRDTDNVPTRICNSCKDKGFPTYDDTALRVPTANSTTSKRVTTSAGSDSAFTT